MNCAETEGAANNLCGTPRTCSWQQAARVALVILVVALVGQKSYISWKRRKEVAFLINQAHATASTLTNGVFYENATIPIAHFPERSMSNPSARNVMISGKVHIGEDEFELAGIHLCPTGTGTHVYTGALQVRFNGTPSFSIFVSSLGSLEANGFAVPSKMVPALIEKTAQIGSDFPPPSRDDFERLLPQCAGAPLGVDSTTNKRQLVQLILSGIHHSLRSRETTEQPAILSTQ